MVKSMTGFASLRGEVEGYSWNWDLRAVNARGLDVKARLPDWIEGLDQKVRGIVTKSVARGSVSLALRIVREASEYTEQVDETALCKRVEQLKHVEAAAEAAGLHLTPTNAADILLTKGILTSDQQDEDTGSLQKALVGQLPELLDAFNQMRSVEGASLLKVLTEQIDRIEALTNEAIGLAEARKDAVAARLRENIQRVLTNTDAVDEARLAQELAVIAVKSDVTEEMDRLHAHVAAARVLLGSDGPVGRKLDFLSQEFNREANTLCSKAQSAELTRVGLDLKATIDQMREQVQNVE